MMSLFPQTWTARAIEALPLSPPVGKRPPFGWPCFGMPSPGHGSVKISWAETLPMLPLALRITTAIDDRECKRIAVRTSEGVMLGEFDLRYAHALETFSLTLPDPVDLSAGLYLEMTQGTSPLCLLAETMESEAPGLTPHLLVATPPTDPESAFLRHLRSPDCQHTWGWMEGCVLDGLERLHTVHPADGYDTAIQKHLARFFTKEGRLLAETPRSEPHDDAIDNIESTLMFAPLAALNPQHPWLDGVASFWNELLQSDGSILDGAMLSAEGSYTIAFPMARLARLRGDAVLATAALRQLEIRREHLWSNHRFWLRWMPADNSRTFPNWARGITWHFLGSVRVAEELAGDARLVAVLEDVRRLAALALSTQRSDGLWNCFIDDPDGTPDTSGSAGIATALALSARYGWIDSALDAANLAWVGLQPYITSDGRLDGVAQSNRGGEALQRSDYRVLSAMGAGLAAQLYAATR